MSSLPTIAIAFDHVDRCWVMESPAFPAPIRFAASGRGAAGLVGALGTAVFTHRDTGGRIEITFANETLRLWFEGSGSHQLID